MGNEGFHDNVGVCIRGMSDLVHSICSVKSICTPFFWCREFNLHIKTSVT